MIAIYLIQLIYLLPGHYGYNLLVQILGPGGALEGKVMNSIRPLTLPGKVSGLMLSITSIYQYLPDATMSDARGGQTGLKVLEKKLI